MLQLIPLAIAAAIIFGSIYVWQIVLSRWHVGRPLIPGSPNPTRWGVIDLGFVIAISIVVSIAVSALSQRYFAIPSGVSMDEIEPAQQIPLLWFSGIGMLAMCVLAAGLLLVRHRITLAELGWDQRFVWYDTSLGVAAFAMLAPVVYGVQVVLTQFFESKHPLIEMLKENPRTEFFVAAGFAAVVVAPVAEEFLFRVLLQGWLERLFSGDEGLVLGKPRTADEVVMAEVAVTGPELTRHQIAASGAPMVSEPAIPFAEPVAIATRVRPILFSSLFFALSHWSHGPDPIPLFIFACGLGYLYQRTHRILPCIVMHLVLNACSLGVLWVAVHSK